MSTTLGDHILQIRKKKKLSQAQLGQLIGTSGDIIGRYERGAMTPSIEVIKRLADVLEVSLDYLVGTVQTELDSQTLKRLEEIAQLPEEKRKYVLGLIDMCLRDFKTRQAYSL